MIILKLYDVADYKLLLLLIDGLPSLSQLHFPITQFDLAKVFDIKLIPSRDDTLKEGVIKCQLVDDCIKNKTYICTTKIGKTGKVNSLTLDEKPAKGE